MNERFLVARRISNPITFGLPMTIHRRSRLSRHHPPEGPDANAQRRGLTDGGAHLLTISAAAAAAPSSNNEIYRHQPRVYIRPQLRLMLMHDFKMLLMDSRVSISIYSQRRDAGATSEILGA